MFRFSMLVFGVLALAGAALAQLHPVVTWRTLQIGRDSQAKKTETFAIDNQGALNDYWVHTFGSLAGVPTNINWAKESVAAVNLGPRAKTGYSAWITSVDKISAVEVRVTWVERYPPSWAANQDAKISPFQLIRMNRVGAQRVSFAQGQSIPAPLAVLAAAGIGTKGGSGGPYYDVPCSGYLTGDICQYTDFYSNVIYDASSFQTYWVAAFGTGVAIPTDIDFQTDQIVVLHLGRRPTTGYGAVVMGLKWTGKSTVTVEWYEKTPPEGSIQAQHVTSPYTLVKLPQGDVKVVFKKIAPPKPKADDGNG